MRLPGISIKSSVLKIKQTPPGLALSAVIISSNKGPLGSFNLVTTIHDFVQLYGPRSSYADVRYFDAVAALLMTCPGVYVCRLRKHDTARHSLFQVNKNESPLGGGSVVVEDRYIATDILTDWSVVKGVAGVSAVQSVSEFGSTLIRLDLSTSSRFRNPDIDILGVKVTHTVPFPVSFTIFDTVTSYTVPGYNSAAEVRTSANGLLTNGLRTLSLSVMGDFPYEVTAVSLLIKGEDVEAVE